MKKDLEKLECDLAWIGHNIKKLKKELNKIRKDLSAMKK